MNQEQLEALRPEVEAREKQQEDQRKAEKDRLELLYRACRLGLILQPKRGRHCWSRKICPKCGRSLDGVFCYLSERLVLIQCKGESCDYEYLNYASYKYFAP
jgi:hypothetical protein